MVGGRDSLDMADPARRLAALAQAPAAVAPRVERPGRDMDRAPERDTERLPAGQVDNPVHTLGVVDRADRARKSDTADKASEVLRRLASRRYMADTGRTASGQEGAIRAPEQAVAPVVWVVLTAVEEQPVPLAAWLAWAAMVAPFEPDCPAVQNGGSVAPRIPDNLDHPDAWRSRNAGRLFHPRR